MANGEHKSLSITARDTVIISATPVPGNEKSVAGIVNALSKIGCSIYDKNEALVHVSGHGNQEELKLMLTMVKPKYFMPVHGEAIHLRAHAKLARAVGIPEKNIFVLDNGDTLELRNHTVRIGEPVDSGVVYVDGLSVTDADPVVLRDRQKLSKDGIVTCVVTVSHRSHKTRAIEIYSRGVSFANDDELNKDAQEVVRTRIDRSSEADVGVDQLRKGIRNGLSNFLWSRTHTRPMVIPVVMEV
jgi:ribonuclease J